MQGSIPYVPFLRAPFYCWVGHVPQLASVLCENKVEAPPHFPPTFLYTMSWEDPRPDAEVSLLAQPASCLSHCLHAVDLTPGLRRSPHSAVHRLQCMQRHMLLCQGLADHNKQWSCPIDPIQMYPIQMYQNIAWMCSRPALCLP